MHMRILNDGVCAHFQVSPEGLNWIDSGTSLNGGTAPALPTSGLAYYGFALGNDINGNLSYNQALIYQNKLSIPAQYTITAATGNATPVVLTIGSHSITPGDLVSVHGMVGNTAANNTGFGVGTNIGASGAASIVTAVNSSTTITIGAITGNGTWTSGGTVTLLSR